MFVGVTEPNSGAPVGAGLHLEAEHRLAQRLRDRLRLLGRGRLVPRTLRVALAQLGDACVGRLLRELARKQEVTCVPARDRDDVAA